MTTTNTSGAADLPEALRSIQRFEVVDCIDDKHVPAVIPKPHGPWVRYEDHIAALAAGQATAAQGVAYADAHGAIMGAAYDFRDAHISGGPNQKRSAHAALESAVTHALRASHGQAPAQAAPAYKDSTPELHIGDSAFESWYSSYSPAHKSDKQRARDAYAAGMGDPLVTAAPAAVTGPSEAVAYLDIGTGGYLDLGTDLAYEVLSRLPKGRHALVIAGTYGIDGYTAAPTTQPAPQQEPSHTSVQLAEMVLSDCGHSSNYTPLLERVAARIDAHVERCLESKKTPQQEAQEPVARLEIGKTKGGVSLTHIAEPAAFQLPEGMYALYTAPQPTQTQAVPLTVEQIHAIYGEVARREPYAGAVTRRSIVRAIEAAHGIKGGQHGTE